MEIRQLEAFAAVMSTGSITAAGQLLGRSQPVVTRVIQELEAELGYALFERAGPRVRPTQRACELYIEVEPFLGGLRQIERRARAIGERRLQPIALVATPAIGAGLLPAALGQLDHALLPEHMQLRTTSAEQIVGALLSGNVDLGVSSLPLEHRGLDLHWIGEAPCVAVLRHDDPLAHHPILPLAALSGKRLLTLLNGNRLRHRLDQAFRSADLAPAALFENSSSLNAMMAAREGLGIAVLEPATAFGVPLEGVVIRPLDAEIPFYFGVFSPSSKPLSSVAEALIDEIERVAHARLHGFKRHPASAYKPLLQTLHAEVTSDVENETP